MFKFPSVSGVFVLNLVDYSRFAIIFTKLKQSLTVSSDLRTVEEGNFNTLGTLN
jgi:hypothetical protein